MLPGRSTNRAGTLGPVAEGSRSRSSQWRRARPALRGSAPTSRRSKQRFPGPRERRRARPVPRSAREDPVEFATSSRRSDLSRTKKTAHIPTIQRKPEHGPRRRATAGVRSIRPAVITGGTRATRLLRHDAPFSTSGERSRRSAAAGAARPLVRPKSRDAARLRQSTRRAQQPPGRGTPSGRQHVRAVFGQPPCGFGRGPARSRLSYDATIRGVPGTSGWRRLGDRHISRLADSALCQ